MYDELLYNSSLSVCVRGNHRNCRQRVPFLNLQPAAPCLSLCLCITKVSNSGHRATSQLKEKSYIFKAGLGGSFLHGSDPQNNSDLDVPPMHGLVCETVPVYIKSNVVGKKQMTVFRWFLY